MNVRLNLNSSTINFTAGQYPAVEAIAYNVEGPTDVGVWNHWLVVWDTSGDTKCAAIYKNGVNTSATVADRTGYVPININNSNTSGFNIGDNGNFGYSTASYWMDQFTGNLSEVYVNFNPALSPCKSNAIQNYNVSSFYNAGKAVDLGANGSTPTGVQPAIYMHWNGSAMTNLGSGGTFDQMGGTWLSTITGAGGAVYSAAPMGGPNGPTPTSPYLAFPPQDSGQTLSYNGYVPQVGDLILLFAANDGNARGAGSVTLNPANGFIAPSNNCAGGASGNYAVECYFYKVITSADDTSLPTLTTSRASIRSWGAVWEVWRGVNTATPIGAGGTWATSDPTKVTSQNCPGFTPAQTGSTIVQFGYAWSARDGSEYLSGNASNYRYGIFDVTGGANQGLELSDFVSTGAAVGVGTMHAASADTLSCVQIELKHP